MVSPLRTGRRNPRPSSARAAAALLAFERLLGEPFERLRVGARRAADVGDGRVPGRRGELGHRRPVGVLVTLESLALPDGDVADELHVGPNSKMLIPNNDAPGA